MVDSHSKNKNTYRKWVVSVVVFIIFLFIGYFILPDASPTTKETDRDINNSYIEGNFYRNTKYDFRIRFPEGWELKPGDGPSVVQKAVSGNSSIIVMVREGEIPVTHSIKDVFSLEDFKNYVYNDIQKSDKNAEILDYGETTLNNKPAYWIKHSARSSTLGMDVDVIGTIYFVVHNGYTYVITTSTIPEEYADIEKIFQKALVTFVFEDY